MVDHEEKDRSFVARAEKEKEKQRREVGYECHLDMRLMSQRSWDDRARENDQVVRFFQITPVQCAKIASRKRADAFQSI